MSLNFMNGQDIFFSCCRVSNKKENINSNKKLYISYRKESLETSISNYLILRLLTICYQNDSTISLVDITFSSRKESKVYYHLVFFVEWFGYMKFLYLCILAGFFQQDHLQLWESIFLAISWLSYTVNYKQFLLIFQDYVFQLISSTEFWTF